jgi:hypothetical protein
VVLLVEAPSTQHLERHGVASTKRLVLESIGLVLQANDVVLW